MAERSTFSIDGAIRLLVVRKILIASPAFWPRIRSTTSRAFWGDVRKYLASALASIAYLSSGPSLSRLRRLLGRRCLGRVSLEHPGGRKFAQLVPHHVLGDI